MAVWACLCHVCGILGCMLCAFLPVGGCMGHVKANVVEGVHVVECVLECVWGPVGQLFWG